MSDVTDKFFGHLGEPFTATLKWRCPYCECEIRKGDQHYPDAPKCVVAFWSTSDPVTDADGVISFNASQDKPKEPR